MTVGSQTRSPTFCCCDGGRGEGAKQQQTNKQVGHILSPVLLECCTVTSASKKRGHTSQRDVECVKNVLFLLFFFNVRQVLFTVLLHSLFRCWPGLVRGHLLHVKQIIWDDFIRFNWESRKRLREAASGKTGPNYSMDDGWLLSLSLAGSTGPPVSPYFQTSDKRLKKKKKDLISTSMGLTFSIILYIYNFFLPVRASRYLSRWSLPAGGGHVSRPNPN